ncbi:MAG: leucyl aminopeptidase family protein [Candidatus Woesearchaeota archaeon]
MKITTKTTGKEELNITPLPQGFTKSKLSKKARETMTKRPDFTGKHGQKLLIQGEPDELLIGAGKGKPDDARKMAGNAAKYARDNRYAHYALDLTSLGNEQAAVEGSLLGLYKYREYKKPEKDDAKDPVALTIKSADEKTAKKAIKTGRATAEGVNLARDLVNRPASDKTPKQLAALARQLGRKHGLTVKVLGKKELEKERMGAMLGVSRGSDKEPQLVILELNKDRKEKPFALAGKGVTFDAGGLQVKPSKYMEEMKLDMGGAATVLATMVTLAKLGHKGRVIGAMGLVENMLGPDAYKPGDILKSRNGKTIELQHTDAEGRLVLADTLDYIQDKYKPAKIIDLATLTGAVTVALGYRVTGLLGNDEDLINDIKAASEATDDLVWELPLWNHYRRLMDNDNADVGNRGENPGPFPGPGTTTAAAFLEHFIKEGVAWAHLDIAGSAFSYENTEYVSKGGTGWGVRLLTHMLTNKNR